MTPCLRDVTAFLLLSLLGHGTQECGDADCEFNVQLLQQDVNLKKDINSIEMTKKMPMHKTESQAIPELLAYVSISGCGPYGYNNNQNKEWCGWYRPRFHVTKSFHCIDQVFTDVCASGIAKLVHVEGDGTDAGAVEIEECSYRFYAQYECLEVIIADLDVAQNYTFLKELEKNLTDMIHAQAIVVSKTTDSYLAAQAVDDAANAVSDELEDDKDAAENKEDLYGAAHGAHAYALYQKKQELDALQNATDVANETLQIVKPKYLAAEAAYQAALGPQPYVEDKAEEAQKEAEEAEAALAAADQAQAAADLAVENMTMKLQKEVQKLNDKNDELREVQKDLDRPLPPST